MKKPFFSVIIPTYQRVDSLYRAVKSVYSQNFEDFEVIVINDCSKEIELIKEKLKEFPLTVINNSRSKGACGSRNTGIMNAQGHWIAFLDDDDIWLPEKLKTQYDFIKEKEEVEFIYSGYLLNYKNKILPKDDQYIYEKNYVTGLITVCVRKELAKKILFNESLESCQDWDFYIRASKYTKLVSLDKVLAVVFTEGEDRISNNYSKKLNGYKYIFNNYSSNLNIRNGNFLYKKIIHYSIKERSLNTIIKYSLKYLNLIKN